MSWDFLLTRSGGTLPHGDLAPIGSPTELASKLAATFPDIDYIDAEWLSLHRSDWLIEINLGSIDPVLAIELSVRGGDDVLPVVRALAETIGCEAFDVGSGKDVDVGTRVSRPDANAVPDVGLRNADDPADSVETTRPRRPDDEDDDRPSGTAPTGALDDRDLGSGPDDEDRHRSWLYRLLHRG